MKISRKMQIEFRDAMKDHLVKAQIAKFFDGADVLCNLDYVPPANISGERKTLIEQYFSTIQWDVSTDVAKVLDAFGAFLSYLDVQLNSEVRTQENRAALASAFRSLVALSKREGLDYTNGRLSMAGAYGYHLKAVTVIAEKIDAKGLLTQARRLESIGDDDPELSIGTSKEMIETTCKVILAERGKSFEGNLDIPSLTKATLRELRLVPEGIQEEKRGSEIIKNLLRSLGSIGNDLAQLRGLYGTGHGRSGREGGLTSRHAKFAVHTAAAYAAFLLETHLERGK